MMGPTGKISTFSSPALSDLQMELRSQGLARRAQDALVTQSRDEHHSPPTSSLTDDDIEKELRLLSTPASVTLCTLVVNSLLKSTGNNMRYSYKDGKMPPWWPADVNFASPSHIAASDRPQIMRIVLRHPDFDVTWAKNLEHKLAAKCIPRLSDFKILRKVLLGAVGGNIDMSKIVEFI